MLLEEGLVLSLTQYANNHAFDHEGLLLHIHFDRLELFVLG